MNTAAHLAEILDFELDGDPEISLGTAWVATARLDGRAYTVAGRLVVRDGSWLPRPAADGVSAHDGFATSSDQRRQVAKAAVAHVDGYIDWATEPQEPIDG
jgi:hypothetical protein